MVTLKIDNNKLARIAETLSSTQKDVELANKNALTHVRRRARASANKSLAQKANLKPRRGKAAVAVKYVSPERFIIFISGRQASVDALKGVTGRKNKPVRYKGNTYPRSFYQYGKTNKKRLLPLARSSNSRTKLEYLTVDILPEAIQVSKETQANTSKLYNQEFERVLVYRRRQRSQRA